VEEKKANALEMAA